MTPYYNEDTLVKQTTAEYLEKQLRWDSIYTYNNEELGAACQSSINES
jgi:type I restriction enzyme, R subunit